MGNRTCEVEGCDEPHRAKGKCAKHYYQGYKSPSRCVIDDCDEPVAGQGWCKTHWQRWRSNGDPLVVRMIIGDDEARFWAKVDKDGPVPIRRPDLGPCWTWTGPVNHGGYGRFTIKAQDVPAHRWAYEHFVKPIPEGYDPDHLCRNTGCVNYESHLEPVTRRENILRSDGPAAINARKTHCIHGHEFTPENTKIRPNGSRSCRTCMAERDRKYRAKRKQERSRAA